MNEIFAIQISEKNYNKLLFMFVNAIKENNRKE